MADYESWLTQADVDGMVVAKLNTICIPLGFWIIRILSTRVTSHTRKEDWMYSCVFQPLWLSRLNIILVHIRSLTMFKNGGKKTVYLHSRH